MSTGPLSPMRRGVVRDVGFRKCLNRILNDVQMLNKIKLSPSRSLQRVKKKKSKIMLGNQQGTASVMGW